MPRMFIKLEDKEMKKTYFFEWSTISDSINSQVVTSETRFAFMYEMLGYGDLAGDTQRLNETGVSSPFYTLDELLECSPNFNTVDKLLKFCRTFAK
jgi:hypothetical protein